MGDSSSRIGVKRIEEPRLIDYRGDLLTVSSSSPLPQGSRVEVPLRLANGGRELTVAGKVVDFSRSADGRFDIVVRCHSLTKDEREAVLDDVQC